jgi:hypothetical protein
MKTNDIKKGMRVKLANGWYGTMADNAKGNTRMVDVEGTYRETGSVYSHDIVKVLLGGSWNNCWILVEHTPAQNKMRKMVENF